MVNEDENKESFRKSLIDYLKALKLIRKVKNERSNLLNKTYWEFENHNLDLFENRESKINKYLNRRKINSNINSEHKQKIGINKNLSGNLIHSSSNGNMPPAFLGSSLGFTKMNFDSKYNEILNIFKLERKPTKPSVRNSLAFENLKLLLMRLYR